MNTLTRHRTTTGAAAVAVAAVALFGPVAPALAAPQTDTGADAIQLSWDGSEYGAVTTESFVGTPVSVPGDHAMRTLHVRNDGPTAGTLRAKITDVVLKDPDSPDVHHEPEHQVSDAGSSGSGGDQGNFYDDVELRWDGGAASLSALAANGETPILEIPLDRGASTEVSIGYVFDASATSGNRANVAPREASFDVVLTLGGDADPEPPITPADPFLPTPSERPESGSPVTTATQRADTLVDTGGSLLWGALAAAVLVPLGLLAGRAGLRRSRAGRA